MSTKETKPLVEQAIEWLAVEPAERMNRWEIICSLLFFAAAVWYLARAWGRNEGMADAMTMHAQARRDEMDSWHERQRRELREDVEVGVRMALDTYEKARHGG